MSNITETQRDEIIADERIRILKVLNIAPDEIRLMAGEMSAQEMRTVLAVLAGLRYRIATAKF